MVQQYEGQKLAQQGAEKAEKARKSAQDLDAKRRRRQVVRQLMISRATALSNTTSRGVSQEGSTLGGLYGQVAQEAGNETTGINLNQQLGNEVFKGNMMRAKGGGQASMGQAIQSVGGMLINNRQEISSVGQNLFA